MPKDLDAHMVCNLSNGEGGHVYFEEQKCISAGKKICALDVDETEGYGMETTRTLLECFSYK